MKQRILFSIALAGLMLGSCSKDAIDGGNGASWNENGEGFISLSLNMPTTSGSASRTAQVDDGVSSEYKVNDAILVLFTGENESSATFNSAYTMGLGNWENDNDVTNQVTTSARIVQKINEITSLSGDIKLYALVVLNANGVIEATSTNGLNVGGSAWTSEKQKLSDLNTSVADVTKDAPWNGSGFLMSNSPLFGAAGGSTQPTIGSSSSTLVEIETENIYTTEAEAIANPAASIYVERAQAKVQVNDATENNTFTITEKDGTTKTTYTYAIKNWDIDNYNTQSKLTREFDDTWATYQNANTTATYRFVDGIAVETGASLYRTYWGKDVNYETNETNPALTTIANAGATPTLSKKPGEYTYCLENTTSEVPATGTQLTRVIISATLAKGADGTAADFFTINGDRSKIYLKASGEGSLENEVKSRILNDEDVKAAAAAARVILTAENLTFAYNDFDSKSSGILDNSKDFTVTFVETITDTDNKIQNAINAVLYTTNEGVNTNNFEIDYYKDGICYYQAFIRHFDDDEAPWNTDTKPAQDASDDEKKKYLGRYGVLRNSWYVLNVNSITQIGDSTYPEIPDEPIDKKEFYISVDIKIMPWAKRTQKVDL